MSKIRIAVDAGHGSNTAGKRTPPLPQDVDFNHDNVVDAAKGDRIREHIANMNVALFLTEELIRCGFSVIVTGFDDNNGYDDEDISLANRQQLIKKGECDYSISIHFNAYGDGESFNSAQGVGVYIHNTYPKDSKALAAKVLSYLIGGMSQTNRGISSAGLAMCNCNAMNTKASILIECAFMTNLYEAINMAGNEDYWEETAVEIAKGICDYTGVAYVEKEAAVAAKEGNGVLYKVQVGAFRSKANADSMVNRVKTAGFSDAFIAVTTVDGRPLYRVQIGAYSIKENADRMLGRVKAAGFADAFIQKY